MLRNVTSKILVVAFCSLLCACGGGSIEKVALIPVKSGSDYQYIDKNGKIVINPQFRQATIFRDGLALIQASGQDSRWGYIDENGKYAINAQFKSATVFSDKIAWVVADNSAPTAINPKGEVLFVLQAAEEVRVFKDGLAAYAVEDETGVKKWGFIDRKGIVAITPQFSKVSDFSEGKCAIRNDQGKWGFIDKKGTIVINPQFDEASDYRKGLCVVSFNGKQGVIDKDGKYALNPQFTRIVIDGSRLLVMQGNALGWCNKDGKIEINPQFQDAAPFSGNALTSVKIGGSYGFIDEDGKIAINPQFDYAAPFNGGKALVISNRKIGFVDNSGKYVVNPQFDDVSPDYLNYILNGKSDFESVRTDYFDVGAISSVVDALKPMGLSINSTYADVMKEFKLDQYSFPKSNKGARVVSGRRINKYAEFDFYVAGQPYDEERVWRSSWWGGGYYDTNLTFDPSNKVGGFIYQIKLKGKGSGKEALVREAIENSLQGFRRLDDEAFTNGQINVAVSDDLMVVIAPVEEDSNIDY